MLRIIIYGTGKYGTTLYEYLSEKGLEIYGFAQTSVDSVCTVNGINVLSIKQLAKTSVDVILIAIGDKFLSRNIKRHLSSIMPNTVHIFECGEFIKNCILPRRMSNSMGGGYCVLCQSHLGEDAFLPMHLTDKTMIDFFETHHVIGGGERKKHTCPICGSSDRERWTFYVLKNHTNVFWESTRVLHIAPESHISEYLRAVSFCDYYAGDINPRHGENKVDVTDIQWRDNFFDYIIMNHVLEHIEDMGIALSELRRVLKFTGKLILSFPYCPNQDTLEIPGINTPELRLSHYGQNDHVRLFGRDFAKIIEKYGWRTSIYSPQNTLSYEESDKNGFIYEDISVFCEIAE